MLFQLLQLFLLNDTKRLSDLQQLLKLLLYVVKPTSTKQDSSKVNSWRASCLNFQWLESVKLSLRKGASGMVSQPEDLVNMKTVFKDELIAKINEISSKEVVDHAFSELHSKISWCPNANTTKSHEMTANSTEDLALREFQKSIGRFLYETGTDFNAVKSESFQLMLGLAHGKTAFEIPSCDDLGGWIFQDLLKEMQIYVRDIKISWESTGCSILLDGWEDSKGRYLINFLVTCPKGTVYIRSVDISTFHPDSDDIPVFFEDVLADVGVKNVIQIISHLASPRMESIGKKLMDKYRTFFWTVSAPYCIELMLEKLRANGFVQNIFKKAKTITRFVHGNVSVLRLLRDQTSVHDLVKPSRIRSIIPFLTLENMVFEKSNLEKLFLSSAWKSSNWATTAEGEMVSELVADRSFWAGALLVVKAIFPLVKVLLSMNKNDESQLGYIYETMDQTKETIRQELKDWESLYLPFWEAIDDIWNNYLHSPLHAAGYFLNPCLFYRNDFHIDSEVTSGLLCCIVRLSGDQTQHEIVKQLDEYQKGSGAFGLGISVLDSDVSPVTWWLEYGKDYPELQRFAIKILSQTCSGASRYHLKRSMAEKLLCTEMNRVEQQKLIDLAFVHYNLQLLNFKSQSADDFSIFEIGYGDWIGDNTRAVSPSDTMSSGANGI